MLGEFVLVLDDVGWLVLLGCFQDIFLQRCQVHLRFDGPLALAYLVVSVQSLLVYVGVCVVVGLLEVRVIVDFVVH